MKTLIFGKLGGKVSEVRLGTGQRRAGWGDGTGAAARATLRAAYETDTTFFDTADVYGDSRGESLIGRFMKETGARGKVVVATKLGRRGDPGWPKNFTRGLSTC